MATGLNDGNGPYYSSVLQNLEAVLFCLSDTITLYSTKCINPAGGRVRPTLPVSQQYLPTPFALQTSTNITFTVSLPLGFV